MPTLGAADSTFETLSDVSATEAPTMLAPSDTKMPRAETALANEIPSVFETPGRYEHLEDFASGGVGRILLVRDKHVGRQVALKELLPERIEGVGTMHRSGTGAPTADMLTIPIIARFIQEARVTVESEIRPSCRCMRLATGLTVRCITR